MDDSGVELPPQLKALAEEFELAADPFEPTRGQENLPQSVLASVTIAGILGIAALLANLISIYSAGAAKRRRRVPDFEALLTGLLDGTITRDEAIRRLARWNPELTPVELVELWRQGKTARYEELLRQLGYPPEAISQILARSFGAIAELGEVAGA